MMAARTHAERASVRRSALAEQVLEGVVRCATRVPDGTLRSGYMAESDAGRRGADALSTEEAERLSERFRPSWEDDPPTVPREPLVVPQRPAPAAQAEPPRVRRPTLVGLSPAEGRNAPPPDELDWEPPTNPLPSASPPAPGPLPAAGAAAPTPSSPEPSSSSATTVRLTAADTAAATAPPPSADTEPGVTIDVEELPPDSKPSGIGEKYVPKEIGAPPVMLDADVQAAEMGARAELEAAHRARRAPTIVRMKAFDIPAPSAAVSEDELRPKRGRVGALVGFGVIGVLLVAAGVAALFRSGGNAEPTTTQAPSAASAPATVVADTAPPPPPPPPNAPLAMPPAVAVSPAPTVATAEPTPRTVAPEEPAAAPPKSASKPAAVDTKSTPTKTVAKAAPAPKPATTSTKPAPKSGAKASSKAVIVRDTPF